MHQTDKSFVLHFRSELLLVALVWLLIAFAAMAQTNSLPPLPPATVAAQQVAKGMQTGIVVRTTSHGSTTNVARLYAPGEGGAPAYVPDDTYRQDKPHGRMVAAKTWQTAPVHPYYQVRFWDGSLTNAPVDIRIYPGSDAAFFQGGLEVGR